MVHHEPQSKHPQHSTHSGPALNGFGHLPFSLDSRVGSQGRSGPAKPSRPCSSSRSPSTFGRTPLTSLASLLLLDVQGDLASLGRPGSVNPRSTQAGQARQSLQYPGALPTTIMRVQYPYLSLSHTHTHTQQDNAQPRFMPSLISGGTRTPKTCCNPTNSSLSRCSSVLALSRPAAFTHPLTFVQPFSLSPSTVSRETWSTLEN
ncbi:hypothetical protein CDEST_13761 [Colletotrichum destructivum]|uniref:Uncharacterized protein n=1 Tax=Colletotrichum destructivum TaxID=34406 RepID=A0AAX4IZR5_9PEZI|nr:hypothetical protein CDEST_13761 [Colletotrichum destructivum]